MPRLLIVNADDYGLSPGVSRGILRAAETGIVSSTTVMINLVDGADELSRLRDSGLPCGCHLNVSCGRPVSWFPEELLDPAGCFVKQWALDPDSWSDWHSFAPVEDEWGDQVQSLAQQDLQPTHIDSHHHVHLQPPLFKLALGLAADNRLGLRVRQDFRQQAIDAGIKCPKEFVEGFFGQGNIDRDSLLALLEATTADVVELMCHPGYVDSVLKSRSGYLEERECELEVLADPGLKSMVEDMGWRLGGYDALAELNEAQT